MVFIRVVIRFHLLYIIVGFDKGIKIEEGGTRYETIAHHHDGKAIKRKVLCV